MSKLEDFFKKIGYSEILTKLESEDEEIDVKDLVENFQSEQEEIYKSKLADNFKGVSKEEEQKIYNKITNSLFQKIKSNLKLTEIGNVKEYDDVSEFLSKVAEEVESRSKQGDTELKSKYDDIVSKYNETLSQTEELQDKLKSKESEFETYKTDLEHKMKVESTYSESFSDLEFGVSKTVSQDYYKWWSNELIENHKVDPKSKKITKLDGTAVLDPETNRKIDTLDEWLQMKVDQRGIGKKSNGKPDGGFIDDEGGNSKKREIYQKAKERGLDVKSPAVQKFLERQQAAQQE